MTPTPIIAVVDAGPAATPTLAPAGAGVPLPTITDASVGGETIDWLCGRAWEVRA